MNEYEKALWKVLIGLVLLQAFQTMISVQRAVDAFREVLRVMAP